MTSSERLSRRTLPLTFLFVAAALAASGCAQTVSPLSQANTGQSGGGVNGLFVTVTPSGTIFVDQGLTRVITATVTNDTGSKGVTWSLSGQGAITSSTTTTATYTAPSSSAPPATISATSITDTTQVARATLFISPLPKISPTTLPNSTVGGPYNSVINVSGGASPFNWSLASGSLPPGLGFSVTSVAGLTISGSPTTAGTFTFAFQVRDTCNAVTSQSYTIMISPAGPAAALAPGADNASTLAQIAGSGVNNALLNGNYAFGFSGFGPQGLVAAAGSFSADGKGNITGGVQDRNSAAGPKIGLAFTGTYSIGANQLGEMTLNNGDGVSATYAIAVTQEGNARFIEIDDTTGTGTSGSGEIKKRDVNALAAGKVAGSYAFELTGEDVRSARLAMIGEFAANDVGALTQGQFDANDAGNVTNLATVSGSYSISATGSGSAVLNASGFGSVHLNLYAASPDEAFAVETDARNTGEPLLTGKILRQSGGPFTTSSLSGSAVLEMAGSVDNVPQEIVGLIQFSGTVDVRILALHANGPTTNNVDESTFLAPSNEGRAVFGSSAQYIIYIVSPNRAFVLGSDLGVLVGTYEAQIAGPLDATSLTGTLSGATLSPFNSAWDSTSSLSFDGIQKGTIFNISLVMSELTVDSAPTSITYTVADGVGQLNSTDGLVGILFIVSPKKAIYVPLGDHIWNSLVIEK